MAEELLNISSLENPVIKMRPNPQEKSAVNEPLFRKEVKESDILLKRGRAKSAANLLHVSNVSERDDELRPTSSSGKHLNILGHLGDNLLATRELSASQLHLLLHPTEEKDDEELRDKDTVVCLNVGGKRHWVMIKNFVSFPGTRLGKLARAKNTQEILQYCDKYFPPEENELNIPEYFFDHTWIGFNSILDVYRYSNSSGL